MPGAFVTAVSVVTPVWSCREQSSYKFPLWSSGEVSKCISICSDIVWAVCSFFPSWRILPAYNTFLQYIKAIYFQLRIFLWGRENSLKHHYFFIVELDSKSWEYFMRKNSPLKFPSVPGGLCGFYKYLISLCCFSVWQLKGGKNPNYCKRFSLVIPWKVIYTLSYKL